MNNSRFPIQKPLITEKAASFTNEGKYVFIVRPDSTKPEIRKAIEKLYGVHITDVNIVRLPGKPKRMGAKYSVTSGKKKAIVTLKKGEVIDVMK
ncbi:MAG: 50S ribosomal protein L23 [Patescibacteria group bacterium]|nr:50S ribosomal protein L23 [Patescibacteria group bacterium]